jgi:hypothetical protein
MVECLRLQSKTAEGLDGSGFCLQLLYDLLNDIVLE